MGQTLYAVIAMMIVSLFAMQQQRHALRAQRDMIDNEIETIATGVAVERLDEIGALAFDQQTKGGRIVTSADALTAREGFGSGDGKDQQGDDIDDADGSASVVARLVGTDTLSFDVTAAVEYADADLPDQPAAQPTKFKLVTVTVTPSADLNRFYQGEGLVRRSITLSQIFTCMSACQW